MAVGLLAVALLTFGCGGSSDDESISDADVAATGALATCVSWMQIFVAVAGDGPAPDREEGQAQLDELVGGATTASKLDAKWVPLRDAGLQTYAMAPPRLTATRVETRDRCDE